jgi:hypothetical protein
MTERTMAAGLCGIPRYVLTEVIAKVVVEVAAWQSGG